jgi:glycosyltransferase involved in cell wall biosynthesis
MKVAIVHDWLTTYCGAEKVLEELFNIYPDADLFSLIDFMPASQRGFLNGRKARTSLLQKLPFARSRYRHYLHVMPFLIEQFDLSGYDIVISSSYCVAKGVITGPDQLHVSYIYSPMRYIWDLEKQYVSKWKGPLGWFIRWRFHRMRLWDVISSYRPDVLVTDSGFVARRIQKTYRRDASVVFPPVDLAAFTMKDKKEEYFVTVSRMVPYKKTDLLVRAFNGMPERRLVVVGDGPDRARIEKDAGPNVTMTGYIEQAQVVELLQNANGFLYAAEEDFGIAIVEAQACGTPVIAYGKGGAVETVRTLPSENPTGILFAEQTEASIQEAVSRFADSRHDYSSTACRENAERFTSRRFRQEMIDIIDKAWAAIKIKPASQR